MTTQLFVKALDDARQHPWESWAGILEGVTEEEARWQAPCYANEPVEEGWPRPGTICWHVAHLAHCKRHYARVLAARTADAQPEVEPRLALASYAEERAALEQAHVAQRAAVAGVAASELDDAVCGGRSVRDFLLSTTRHDTWHGGQIAVLRRLFRERATPPAG